MLSAPGANSSLKTVNPDYEFSQCLRQREREREILNVRETDGAFKFSQPTLSFMFALLIS